MARLGEGSSLALSPEMGGKAGSLKSAEKAILKIQLGELREPDMSGVLLKRGKLNKAFRRRWFLLFDSVLLYYKPPLTKMSKPTGVMLFDAAAVAAVEDGKNSFTIAVGDRVLRCTTADALAQWLAALQSAAPISTAEEDLLAMLKAKEEQ